jgi:hypothetical protein
MKAKKTRSSAIPTKSKATRSKPRQVPACLYARTAPHPRAPADGNKAGYPQISQKDADFGNFKSAKSAQSADLLCLMRVAGNGEMKARKTTSSATKCHPDQSKTTRSRPRQVPARLYARTAPHARAGTRGPRPCFEGAQFVRRCAPFLKVRILENAGDSFEDAHPFPRCARKLRTFERRLVRSPVSAGSHDLSCTADLPRRLRPLGELVQMS